MHTFSKTVPRGKKAQNPCQFSLLDSCLLSDIRNWKAFWFTDENVGQFCLNGKTHKNGLVYQVCALIAYIELTNSGYDNDEISLTVNSVCAGGANVAHS